MLTEVLLCVLAALTGVGVGVAVNALADRVVGVDEPIWCATQCRACLSPLASARVPAIAELFGPRRACKACGAPASYRRVATELALMCLYPLLVAHLFAPTASARIATPLVILVDAAALGILAFVFVVDLEHRLIFDLSLYPLAACAVVIALIFDHKALAAMLFGAIIGGGLFLLFYGLGWLLYRQEALGFGDVKLAVLVGVLVGWPAITTALLITALVGAAVSMLLLGFGNVSRHTYIPFGTFLSAGAALTLLISRPLW